MLFHYCLFEALSPKLHFAIIVLRTFSWEILVLGLSHHPMTTPNSTISEPYKHLTMVRAISDPLEHLVTSTSIFLCFATLKTLSEQ